MKIKTYVAMFVAIAGLTFASCSDDNNGPSYDPNGVEVANAELKTKLQALGYTFNEKGNLVQDEKVQQTTSLDLSNANLTSAEGLGVFPNLTEVKLSNNKFGDTFDFSQLPEKVTAVDLTGNEIYDYNNLVKTEIADNGEETITNLHPITKLYLPEDAKYNCTDIVRFYRQNKSDITGDKIDLKMEDDKGGLATYTTLRTVPDEKLRTYLKKTYASLFNGDQIDLSKHLNNNDKSAALALGNDQKPMDLSDLEGVQYIIQNPYWVGASIYIAPKEELEMPYVKVSPYVTTVGLSNLNMQDQINLEQDTALVQFGLNGVKGISKLDISPSVKFGQRGVEAENNVMGTPSVLVILDCPDLKEIKLPAAQSLSIYDLEIEALPALEVFDMSAIYQVSTFKIGDVSSKYNLVYPDLKEFYSPVPAYFPALTSFGCSESTYAQEATQKFITKYFKAPGDKDNKIDETSLSCPKNKTYDWKYYWGK